MVDGTDRIDRFGGRDVRWLRRPGRGVPAVLLGGCGVPYPMWQPVLDAAPQADLIRMDRPGMSGTDWPGVLPRLADEVETLSGLVSAVGQAVILVGHSMAGPHVEALARCRPDQVAGVVLVDGSLSWRPRPGLAEAPWLTGSRLIRQLHRLPAVPNATAWMQCRVASWQSLRTDPRTLAALNRTYRDRQTLAMVTAESASYGRQLSDLASIRERYPWPGRPTILLTAAGGPRRQVTEQARLAEYLGAEQRVLDGCRHLVMLDRPDAVARAIDDLQPG
jgi:pimeloyl-ACP methyl ester carboxylesterase